MDTYSARTGDTLPSVAEFFGLGEEELRAVNPGLGSEGLAAGQALNLPRSARRRVPVQSPESGSWPSSIVAPDGGSAPALWYAAAAREMATGVDEDARPGRHNPRILEYHASTSLRATDDETPWCSAFVNWCVERSGLRGTDSASARSWLGWGVGVDLDAAPRGSIVVLSRGSDERKGHVGFLHALELDRVLLLGGNQGDQANISSYPRGRVVGCRVAP